MTNTQLQTLKTELLLPAYSDLVISGKASDPGAVAVRLNTPNVAIQLPRPDVTPLEILEAIKVTDFINSPNVLYASWFESLTQFQSIRVLKENGTDARVMTNIMSILVNGSASETRVRALAVRAGSRAEQLFGVGFSIAWEEVQQALALP